MATPVSYAKAIRPLFRQVDIDHMKPFDVKLDDYSWMSDPAGGTVGSCNDYRRSCKCAHRPCVSQRRLHAEDAPRRAVLASRYAQPLPTLD